MPRFHPRFLPLLCLSLLLLPASSRAAEPDKYLLDDTDGLLTLNVRQIVDSPLFKKNYMQLAQKLLRTDADLQAQLKELGLDPLKDIDRILINHGESSHRLDEKNPGGMTIIVRGRFDSTKLHAKAAALAKSSPKLMKAEKTSGGMIYELKLDPQSFYLAMPDKTTVFASPFKDHVLDALEKGAGKKKTQLKHEDVQSLLSQADAKQSFWLLATGRMAYGIAKGKKLTLAATAGVEEASGGITIGDEVKSSFSLTVRDEQAGKEVAGSLQQDLNELLEAAFKASGKDKRLDPLREFLRTLEITAKDKKVTLQGEVAAKIIEDSMKP